MPTWILPSDSHSVGDTGHTTDHNHIVDDLSLIDTALPVVSGGLTGATAATRFAGATASGAPASGTFAVGDEVIDQTGTIWVCTTAGSPGTWTAMVNLASAQTITGAKVFKIPGSAGYSASGPIVISTDGTDSSGGAIGLNPNSEHYGYISIYSSTFSAACYMVPDVITTHYAPGFGLISATGFGIIGSTFSTGATCFAVVNFNQFGTGLGGATFTCLDNDVVVTFNNTLDDGSGNMIAAGGLTTKLRTITASATLTGTDSTVLLNAATLTATLPTAVGITGREYTVKVVFAATTGTVATTSSQTIDGAATYSLSAVHKYVTVQSDGANWQIVANN